MRTEKFKSLFKFAAKSQLKASDESKDGIYPFYTSSTTLSKKIDKAIYFDESLIIGNGGSANIHHSYNPFSTTSHCFVAIPKASDINSRYVYYFLHGNIHLLERGFKGAGLKNISKSYIEDIDIPVLPIETQNKIVSVLDRATLLVKKREETIQLINELQIAIFLDMFGDPYTNPKNWKTDKLEGYIKYMGDIGSNGSNAVISKNLKMIDEEDYALMIRTVNLSNNDFSNNLKFVSKETYDFFKKSKIYGGEIIMNKIGSNAGDFWIMPDLKRPVSLGLNQLVIRTKNLNLIFLYYYLSTNYGKLLIKSKVRGAATKSITKTAIKELRIFQPPIELQNAFEKRYLKSMESVQKLEASRVELNILLSSILQKVFNGQLNFNVDFELDALIKEIDLQKKENDLTKISGDIAYLQRLVDKLNDQEFIEKDLYDKAKHGLFQLMSAKEENRKVTQEYDNKNKKIKLTLI